MNSQSRKKSAFTLLEIMIVITIIGVLAAMAVPSFQKSLAISRRNACIINLKNIESAKVQWMSIERKTGAETPTDEDLFGEDKFISAKPICPGGGTYDLR